MSIETGSLPFGSINVAHAASIVSAYVRNNTLQVSELPELIRSVYGALQELSNPESAPEEEPLRPASLLYTSDAADEQRAVVHGCPRTTSVYGTFSFSMTFAASPTATTSATTTNQRIHVPPAVRHTQYEL